MKPLIIGEGTDLHVLLYSIAKEAGYDTIVIVDDITNDIISEKSINELLNPGKLPF